MNASTVKHSDKKLGKRGTEMMNHVVAFISGYVLDLIVGDPYWFYHPVRLIGNLIGHLEKKWNTAECTSDQKRKRGIGLVVVVLSLTVLVSGLVLIGAYLLHWVAGIIVESIMTYQILATKSLRVESMKVYHALRKKNLEDSRKAVSMIVGRDTQSLDEEGVAKAAIETVAENTSDGVIAPMICLAIGGPILAWGYKAINTMDSMVGYKNERYMDFGRCAAKLDDIVNYLPARLSAGFMIFISAILQMLPIYVSKEAHEKVYNFPRAIRIFRRDRYNHASPNSAQTEAVCAGSLGIRLAGDASYFGKIVKKPYIGDANRLVVYEDIRRANVLMYGTSVCCMAICVMTMLVVGVLI